ncbi:MAG TPA: SDR family NAD(P)-dependent oxidoreductase [Terriglobales bacterium]|jgi:uncharacterized oxidoreductase
MHIFGNTILITGGGSGIGLALACALVERNNRVMICGRDEAKLAAARSKMPTLETKRCDLTRRSEREELAGWTLARAPSLNVLINNAGVVRNLDLTENGFNYDDLEGELVTDLHAPIELGLRFLAHLKRQPHAALINVTTGQVYSPNAGTPVYSAAKVGLHAWTQAVRYQLRNTSVRVFEVLPPIVDTDMIRKLGVPKSQAVPPEEVAESVLKGVAEDEEEIRIGPTKTLYVMSRIAPQRVYRSLNQKIENMRSRMGGGKAA